MADQERFREIKRRYYRIPLAEFSDQCSRLGRELARMVPRSYRERNELAEQAVDALLEVSRRLEPGEHTPGEPEQPASRGTPVSVAFLSWYDRSRHAERQRTIWRAAEWVLRERADGWLRPRTVRDFESPDRLGMALESDEGLATVLRELDAFPTPTR